MPSATMTIFRGRQLSPCLICGKPSPSPRCAEHTIDKGYETEHWQSIRAARLELDRHICQLTHPGCAGRATTVHLDESCNGDHSLATVENTLSACRHCHGVEDGPRSTR